MHVGIVTHRHARTQASRHIGGKPSRVFCETNFSFYIHLFPNGILLHDSPTLEVVLEVEIPTLAKA